MKCIFLFTGLLLSIISYGQTIVGKYDGQQNQYYLSNWSIIDFSDGDNVVISRDKAAEINPQISTNDTTMLCSIVFQDEGYSILGISAKIEELPDKVDYVIGKDLLKKHGILNRSIYDKILFMRTEQKIDLEIYESAISLYNKRLYLSAASELKKLEYRGSLRTSGLYELGECYYYEEKYTDAIQCFEKIKYDLSSDADYSQYQGHHIVIRHDYFNRKNFYRLTAAAYSYLRKYDKAIQNQQDYIANIVYYEIPNDEWLEANCILAHYYALNNQSTLGLSKLSLQLKSYLDSHNLLRNDCYDKKAVNKYIGMAYYAFALIKGESSPEYNYYINLSKAWGYMPQLY